MLIEENVGPLVCKFGGTSLADADQIRQVESIIRSNPQRRCIVVSAPGKRAKNDRKITDLLYQCHHAVSQGEEISSAFAPIRERFETIGSALDLSMSRVHGWLDEIETQLAQGRSTDWVASRGEHLSARLIADYLKARFVESADCIQFTAEGRLDPISYVKTREALTGNEVCIIPGFYGSDVHGGIKTFSRGGSDITGAIVARAVNASAYENWTDVDGLRMADPRVIENARAIREVTYQELRELAYMGATVMHDEAILPVREASIPINIRNTNDQSLPGTWIRATRSNTEQAIVGIAGRRGFTTIQVAKSLMNQEVGFGRRMLQVLEEHGISYEHAPSSIDTMSVIIQDDQIAHCLKEVLAAMERVLQPDRIEVFHGLALIATVGQGMSNRTGTAGRLMSALAEANVNIRMIDQGASEINIIVGVMNEDFETALRAIYNQFVT